MDQWGPCGGPDGVGSGHPGSSLPLSDPGYPGPVENYWVAVFWSLIPTVVVSGLFFFVLRSILRADRTERRAYDRIEAEQRAKRGLAPLDPGAPDTPR